MSVYFQKIKAAVAEFFSDSIKRYISIGALALLLVAGLMVTLVISLGKGQDVASPLSDSDDVISNDTVSYTAEQDNLEYNSYAGKALTAYSDGWIYYTVPIKCSPHYNGTSGITYQSGMFYPDKKNPDQSGLFRVRPNGSGKQHLVNRAIYDILVSGEYIYFAAAADCGDNLQSDDKDLYKIRVDDFLADIKEEQLLCTKINSSKYERLNLTLVDDRICYTVEGEGLYSISTNSGEPQLVFKPGYQDDSMTIPGYSVLLFESDKIFWNSWAEVQTRTGEIYDSFGSIFVQSVDGSKITQLSKMLGTSEVLSDGDWLYFEGGEDNAPGMDISYFLCRAKKDGSKFEKILDLKIDGVPEEYGYNQNNIYTFAVDDDYLYVYMSNWTQPTDRGEPESMNLYRMDKNGESKTLLLKNGWDDAFEPSSAPTSYFASNLTIHDGWIYAVLHERPFDGQIDTERYSLVRINAKTGVLENPLPGGSYVLVRSHASFYAEPDDSSESRGGSNGLSYYEFEFTEKTVNGQKWYKIFINEFGTFWMKSDGIVLVETAAQNRAENGFIIKETSIDELVAKYGMYQTFESSYCPANGDTEIRLIWPDFAIDLVANNISFAGNGGDGYNFGDKVNVLTDVDKKLTLRTEAIYSTNKTLREGIEIGDHITSVEEVIKMTYWSEDRPCMEVKNQYLEDSYLAGLPIKIQADKCFTAYNTETVPTNYYVDYAEWTTYYFKGNELVAVRAKLHTEFAMNQQAGGNRIMKRLVAFLISTALIITGLVGCARADRR